MKNWVKKVVKSGVLFFCFCIGLWPRSWIRALGGFFGFLWIDLLRVRRQVVLDNLAIAFPHMSKVERLKLGRRSVYSLGYNFTEFFTIPSLDLKWVARNVVIEGENFVQAAHAENKGVLLLSMHLGNADLAMSALALCKYPIVLITKIFQRAFLNEIWFSVRGAHGVKYINAHSPNNAFEILQALRKKQMVIFVLDQFMGKPFGIETTFFSKKVGTAYGLALFYLKTKVPVVPVYTYEGRDHKMHIVFEKQMSLDHLAGQDDKDGSILRLTQAFNDKIEEVVKKYPEQWMWVHRRWKEFE